MPTSASLPGSADGDASRHSTPAPLSRRQVMHRLAVGGAIVWTAPLISKTAYAASATSCTPRILDFNTLPVGSTFNSAVVGGVTVTLAPSSFFGGSTALGTNRTIVAGPQGGAPDRALRFEQTPRTNGGQVITITFSQPVYTVAFTIIDIDNFISGTTGWSDRIAILSPATFTFAPPVGSTVIGNGTLTGATNTTGPFRNSQANNNLPNSSNAGNIGLTFPGPLTQLQIAFGNGPVQNGSNQLINLTNISFCS